MRDYLTSHEIDWCYALPDERLAGLPLVSTHSEPQIAPKEYECGCVTVTRITDRDHRRGERPFEMRLAVACEGGACEILAAARSSEAPLEGVDLERSADPPVAPTTTPPLESRSRGRGDVAGSPPSSQGGD